MPPPPCLLHMRVIVPWSPRCAWNAMMPFVHPVGAALANGDRCGATHTPVGSLCATWRALQPYGLGDLGHPTGNDKKSTWGSDSDPLRPWGSGCGDGLAAAKWI